MFLLSFVLVKSRMKIKIKSRILLKPKGSLVRIKVQSRFPTHKYRKVSQTVLSSVGNFPSAGSFSTRFFYSVSPASDTPHICSSLGEIQASTSWWDSPLGHGSSGEASAAQRNPRLEAELSGVF